MCKFSWNECTRRQLVVGYCCIWKSTAIRAGEIIKPNTPLPPLSSGGGLQAIQDVGKVRYHDEDIKTEDFRLEIQILMQRTAAALRIQKTFEEGCQLIDACYSKFGNTKICDRDMIWNTDRIETLVFKNVIKILLLLCIQRKIENNQEGLTKEKISQKEMMPLR